MPFQVSPSVVVTETDLTNVIPAVATSIGGFAGYFRWGPIGTLQLVTNEKELGSLYGLPDAFTRESFFTASSFLNYSNALKVSRADNSALLNAKFGGGAAIKVKNADEWEALATKSDYAFMAKYAGSIGNSIDVVVLDETNFSSLPNDAAFFDSTPLDADNEVHVLIKDKDGVLTGTAATVLETFPFVSTVAGTKKEDGSSNYVVDVVTNQSAYVNAGTETDTNGLIAGSGGTYALAGGVDASTETEADITTAIAVFSDLDQEDVNLLFTISDVDGAFAYTDALRTVAETRKDCMGFASPPQADTVNLTDATALTNALDWANSVPSTSYLALGSGSAYVYDRYNDVNLWIGTGGHMAGLCANTDNLQDSWWSPSGLNRGILRGVSKMSWNPNKARRDELYKARLNPILAIAGQGIVLYGDKTALSKPSAFDRINVRRLFIVLAKAISTAARYQLFEFNDEFTRANFRNLVDPFLRDVQGRRGLTDFRVICDETNNTGEIIDRNEFVADIYLKPSRSINYITLNLIATRTDVSFEEIIGLNQ